MRRVVIALLASIALTGCGVANTVEDHFTPEIETGIIWVTTTEGT